MLNQINFIRADSILVPEIENYGFGEIIAGVDFDEDNLIEIYVVNNMNDNGGNELIPRIYKYEFDGTSWNLVWEEHSRDILQQNSWAPITYGDIDNDGNLDFILGSRQSTPTVAILRMEFQGGDIADSNNYHISLVDSLYPSLNPGRYDIVSLANLDDDPELEILYTNGSTCERFPIVILDLDKAVSVENNSVPIDFTLEQNYPNPFNPSTKIGFSIPEQTKVSLKIFNALGQLITTLIESDILSAGSYSYKFNAKDLASGIYMYSLETELGVLSKKMIIIK